VTLQRSPGPEPALSAIRALTSRGLPGAPDLADVAGLRGPPDGGLDLVRCAEGERLLGPLHHAASSGEVQLSDDATQLLVDRHSAVMAWCIMIEARLLEVRDWFAEAGGVEHRVIKGPAVAHLDEDDPADRSFADLDLLVASADLDRAVRALQACGATRPWPERRRGFDRRFAKSVTLTSGEGIEVDLHRTLCDGVHGARIHLDELFDAPDEFRIGGEAVKALSRPHRMVHAAYHAVLGSPSPRLLSLRDLARYLTAADLQPDAILPIVRRWRGEAVLAVAVRETLSQLSFKAPEWSSWLAEVRIDPAERRLVDRQRTEGSSFGPGKFELFRELGGFHDKLAYGFAAVWPTSEHLRARGLTRSDQLHQLAPGRILRSAGAP